MQAILIASTFLCYLLLLIQYKISASKGAKALAEVLEMNNSLQLLNTRTIVALPLMILCILLYAFTGENKFLLSSWSERSGFLTTILLCFSLLVSVYSSEYFKGSSKAIISAKQTARYLFIRISGLVAYEMFFRGVLLGIFLEWFSLPVAFVLNVALYAFAHAFSARKEMVGSVPFGLLLCYITVLNHSVYPSVLLHLVLAIPHESILLSKCQLLTKNNGL